MILVQRLVFPGAKRAIGANGILQGDVGLADPNEGRGTLARVSNVSGLPEAGRTSAGGYWVPTGGAQAHRGAGVILVVNVQTAGRSSPVAAPIPRRNVRYASGSRCGSTTSRDGDMVEMACLKII